MQEHIFEGDVEAAARLDGERTMCLWRNAGPAEDEGVLATGVGGQREQALDLAQLVRLEANGDGGLGRLPVSWGGRDRLVYCEGWGIRLQERKFRRGEMSKSKNGSEKNKNPGFAASNSHKKQIFIPTRILDNWKMTSFTAKRHKDTDSAGFF